MTFPSLSSIANQGNPPGQGPTRTDVWQAWDAFTGGWSLNGAGGPGAVRPLSDFGASHILGIRIALGCSVDGVGRTRATDDFEIGVGGATPTVFDFERN